MYIAQFVHVALHSHTTTHTQIVSFPMSYGKNPFAYSFKQSYPSSGWEVYNAEKELARLVRLVNYTCICVYIHIHV